MILRKRYIEVESSIHAGVQGFYTVRAIKPGIGVVRELTFPNIITDTGLNAIGAGINFNYMCLGTGTGTPSASDTALGAFGVSVNPSGAYTSTSGVVTGPPSYGWRRHTWTSAVGGATGNWTELGVNNQNTNGNLRSRALFLDGGGSPVTFPVQSDESFQGTYEFRCYSPAADNPASITLSGTPYDTVTRALRSTSIVWAPNITNPAFPSNGLFDPAIASSLNPVSCGWFSGGLGAVSDTDPGGSILSGSTTAVIAAYGSGNFYRDYGLRSGAADYNGVVRTFRYVSRNCGAFQIEYTPTITKTNIQELIHNQRISWTRV